MRKREFVALQEVHHVLEERRALRSIHSPFVLALHGAFQDEHALYYVLEYLPGRDLHRFMMQQRSIPMDGVRFITMQVGVPCFAVLFLLCRACKHEQWQPMAAIECVPL